MTIQEVSLHIDQALAPIYPVTERESIIFLIVNHWFGFKRSDMLQKANVELPALFEVQMYNIIEQLKQHKPIQYILGETEFYGLPFYVNENVLIPRPETEELVQWVIHDHQGASPGIIDIGTGSGCIAIALAKHLPGARITGADISEKALDTARKNAERNDCHIHFANLDILSGNIPDPGTFDIIVSNPPYITHEQKADMHANVLDYEPSLALFAPAHDPLIFYKAISRFASKNLSKGGNIYLEINEALPEETAGVFRQAGYATEIRKDINNKYRMIKAIRL